MTIPVTGVRGKVGRATVAAAQQAGHDVVATDQRPPSYGPTAPRRAVLSADLTDAGGALDLVGRVRPDAIAGIPEPFQDPLQRRPDPAAHLLGEGACTALPPTGALSSGTTS